LDPISTGDAAIDEIGSEARAKNGEEAQVDSLQGLDPKNKKIYRRYLIIEKAASKVLFQINHVILSNQAVNVPFFHLVLFLSFLQILFNIFYKVDILNEFNVPEA
jgi:hypothetical protein